MPTPIRILTMAAILATIGVNAAASSIPLNGRTTGAISDSFTSNLFVPAGWVFAIWGLIYLGQLAFGVYQLLPAQRDNRRIDAASLPIIASCVFNGAWIFAWHWEQFPLTMVLMIGLLASLAVTYVRLRPAGVPVSTGDRWFVLLPFSIYLGWITVATIANASITLIALGYEGAPFGAEAWAVILLLVGVLLGSFVTLSRGDPAYAAVLVWAFAGIGVKQSAVPLVSQAAWAAAGVMALVAVLSLVLPRLRPATAPRLATTSR